MNESKYLLYVAERTSTKALRDFCRKHKCHVDLDADRGRYAIRFDRPLRLATVDGRRVSA